LILWSVSESIARQPPEIDRDRETKCREEVHRQAGRRTLAIEILQLKRSDRAVRTEVLPKRWIVERTFAWFNRCRRLATDFENLTRSALAFIQPAGVNPTDAQKVCNFS
jgi:transposase